MTNNIESVLKLANYVKLFYLLVVYIKDEIFYLTLFDLFND